MRSDAKIGLAVVMLMAAVGTASAFTSIKNSKHDLSSAGGQTYRASNTDQICVFCHTPHNAKQDVPLWNRSNPTGTFILYSSTTMDNVAVKSGFTSDSISLFCMSCHDGSTQLGAAVHNDPNGTPISMEGGLNLITGDASLTTDLSDDHPVNFMVTDGTDPNIGTVASGTPWTIKTDSVTNGLPLFKSGRGVSTLECGSCHAVHDNTDAPFLRTTMKGSLLCLGCHKK